MIIKRCYRYLILFIYLFSLSITLVAEESTQTSYARKFINSLTRKDMKTVLSYSPTTDADFFGQSPFTTIPKISDPIVRGTYAIFRWEGTSITKPAISSGYILLRLKSNIWLFRQLYYTVDTPDAVIKTLKKRKETAEDKMAMPVAMAMINRYMGLWLKEDYKEMKPLWYDWTLTDRSKAPLIKPKISKISESVNNRGETVIDFKLSFFWGLAQDIKGTFIMLQEVGKWKIRISSIELYK